MSDYGITSAGFVKKSLDTIKTEIEDDIKGVLGTYVNQLPESVLGNLNATFADRVDSLWSLSQDVYDSQYPSSAENTSLDNVAGITGTTRDGATYSTNTVALFGTATTVVSSGTVFSVSGNPDARFETLASATIGAGTDEVQGIAYSATPDAGSIKYKYWNIELSAYETTAAIAFNASTTDIEDALNALSGLSGVTVSGSWAAGHSITFAGSDGKQPQELLVEDSNTLIATGSAVTVTITETTPGEYQATVSVQAEETGQVVAYTKTMTVIETPVSGLDRIFNIEDATLGSDEETDAELRLKRENELGAQGACTVETIRARILAEVDDVTDCIVFENDTNTVDANGLPQKSIRCYVTGGAEQDIADKIWAVKGGGIEADGSISKTVTDSQGINRTIKFSRPISKDIYVEVDLTVTSDYPGDSDTLDEILSYGNGLSQGENVVAHGNPSLEKSISNVAGITDIVIRIGFAPGPVSDDNLVIAINEIADFDSSRVTINS